VLALAAQLKSAGAMGHGWLMAITDKLHGVWGNARFFI
jgi:hypothetical protein